MFVFISIQLAQGGPLLIPLIPLRFIQRLKYTLSCYNESIRMFPPVNSLSFSV
jgi:hypothetical protein